MWREPRETALASPLAALVGGAGARDGSVALGAAGRMVRALDAAMVCEPQVYLQCG